eukprot:5329522-Pyramimonas_sp.AAC.1
MPQLMRANLDRESIILPAVLDSEYILRVMKTSKSPGPDGFPSALLKAAPREIARARRPLPCKIALSVREPLVFKLGEVTFFYKGPGTPQLARAQRNITMASTICKLYLRHARNVALDFFDMCLLAEQCGGVACKGPEMPLRGIHLLNVACEAKCVSLLCLSLDLVDAFYSVIKQFALSLPGEEDKLADALEQ